mmetsp:Transcript_3272/g.4763  ORF Transcript_3272/g.4763 Transcript_3272/m.4763 type:complete len:390 (-) Transcript_3272:170-1339(-)
MILHLLISLLFAIVFNHHENSQAVSPFAYSSFITEQRLRCTTAVQNSNRHPCNTGESNDAMITWPASQSISSSSSSPSYSKQTKQEARSEIISYLYKNLMPFDFLNARSLGFPPSDNSTNGNGTLPDGLSNGILEPTVNISLYAKQNYPWTKDVPKDLYYEYVASFANVNEARSNWRPVFHDLVKPIIEQILTSKSRDSSDIPTAKEIVQSLNDQIWTTAATYSNSESIKFQHGQTPLIYDPMSVLIFGYASCTGLSIFFVNILRTAGIPARLAGTAAWNDKEEDGNHSWIEFWSCDDDCGGTGDSAGGRWHIMESKPASGSHGDVDLYDPCQWWFCNEERVKDTFFWAARLDREESEGILFPMAWDLDNIGVVGEDRTAYMRDLCSGC